MHRLAIQNARVSHPNSHLITYTGVSEAIRAAKLAKTELEREQEETESLRHNLDILKVKVRNNPNYDVKKTLC